MDSVNSQRAQLAELSSCLSSYVRAGQIGAVIDNLHATNPSLAVVDSVEGEHCKLITVSCAGGSTKNFLMRIENSCGNDSSAIITSNQILDAIINTVNDGQPNFNIATMRAIA